MPRSLTPDDLYAFKLVEDPRIAPDGATIAYIQQDMDRATYEYRRSIWLVPTEGGAPRRFTAGPNDSAPRWAADGKYLAFVRAPAGQMKPANKEERERGKGKPQIWVIPVDGGEARQVTFMRYGVGEPVWSPDATTLLFCAQTGSPDDVEAEDAALEGRNVPKVRTIDQLVYKHDGVGYVYELRTHLFSLCVACALHGDRWDVRADRHAGHAAGHDGHDEHSATAIHQEAHAVGTSGAPRQLTDGDWNDTMPVWSPDGRRIAFVSDRSDERWRYPANAVWVLDLSSGGEASETRLATPERRGSENGSQPAGGLKRLTDEALNAVAPVWSPDGTVIAFLADRRRHNVGHEDLYVVGADAEQPGTERMLTWEFTPTCADTALDDMRSSHGAAHLTWSPDSQEVFFLGSTRGATHLYAARPSSDRLPRRLTDGQCRIYGYSLDRDCRALVLAVSTPTVPGDLYTQPVLAGDASITPIEPRRLTDLNAALLGEVALARPEEFEFRGADDWALQGWVLRPAAAPPDEALPAILSIHGGPAAMYGWAFFFEFQLLAGAGYAVVYCNPRGSTGYGRVFSGAVINDFGGKDAEDLLRGLDTAIARGCIDGERLGVGGGSYGGFMTNWLVGHSDRFKAGVSMRSIAAWGPFFGMSDIGWRFSEDELSIVPWRDQERGAYFSPITYVERIHAPLLILHSDQDLRCPVGEAEQLFIALKFLGRAVRFVRFEGQSHDLSRSGHPRSRVIRYREILSWFQRHIPARAAAAHVSVAATAHLAHTEGAAQPAP
jgi:dipeptidyl aminopeptidase/acylaminoacyl peptidase